MRAVDSSTNCWCHAQGPGDGVSESPSHRWGRNTPSRGPAVGLQVLQAAYRLTQHTDFQSQSPHTDFQTPRFPTKCSGPPKLFSGRFSFFSPSEGSVDRKTSFSAGKAGPRGQERSQPGELAGSCVNPASLKNKGLLFSSFKKEKKKSFALQG